METKQDKLNIVLLKGDCQVLYQQQIHFENKVHIKGH